VRRRLELGDHVPQRRRDLRRLKLAACDLCVVVGGTEVLALAGEPVAQLPEMDANAVGPARGAGPMTRMVLNDLRDVRHVGGGRRRIAGSDAGHERVPLEGIDGRASKRALPQKALETHILWVRNCSGP